MDNSLCVFNKKSKYLQWAGANNPLWIKRSDKMIEFKGDKQPIGKLTEAVSFTFQNIDLEKNDELFMLTFL